MQVKVDTKPGTTILTPIGDVDLSVAREFQGHIQRALEGRPSRLVVDLGSVPYMDSSGVATLVEALQKSKKQATALVLCALQDKVRSIFEIARLDRIFTIVSGVEKATSA